MLLANTDLENRKQKTLFTRLNTTSPNVSYSSVCYIQYILQISWTPINFSVMFLTDIRSCVDWGPWNISVRREGVQPFFWLCHFWRIKKNHESLFTRFSVMLPTNFGSPENMKNKSCTQRVKVTSPNVQHCSWCHVRPILKKLWNLLIH